MIGGSLTAWIAGRRFVGLLGVLWLSGCASVPDSSAKGEARIDTASGVQVVDSLLARRIDDLGMRSAIWRAGLDTVRAADFRVIVGRPAQIRSQVPGLAHYRARHFGEVLPLRDADGDVIGAVVAVDVVRLRRLCRKAGLPGEVVESDVDRILIHEIYGHVVPLAQSRRISGGCPDPAPGDPARSSCAIRRENRIRAELGLEERTAYDIRGLVVGRHLHGAGPAGRPARPDDR